jgi:hypothetical protein
MDYVWYHAIDIHALLGDRLANGERSSVLEHPQGVPELMARSTWIIRRRSYNREFFSAITSSTQVICSISE